MKPIRFGAVLERLSIRIVAGAILASSVLASYPVVLAQGGGSPGSPGSPGSKDHWVGTWATALVARPQTPPGGAAPPAQTPQGQTPQAPRPAVVNFNNQTLRQIVRVSIGGERVRVVLSNVFGTAPLMVGAAHVALREKEAAIAPKSGRALTFSGRPTATILPGAIVVSDPVSLRVPPLTDLVVDVYLPGDTAGASSPLTFHNGAFQTNYVSQSGNHAGAADMPVTTTMASWFFLARVEVIAPEQVGAVVALGASIVDGTASTPNSNGRWPDQLAKRFAAANIQMGVLNAGIAGNRVLADGNGVNALARFDRDVLNQTGVTHVIVMEGNNDMGTASAADLIAAHKQLIERAHARGLKIYGATLTPFEGSRIAWSPEIEAKRNEFNDWVRTGKAYDGVMDSDAAMRDPDQRSKLLQRYNSGDNLHPNDAGYEAMARSFDLGLLKAGQRTTATTR